MIIWFEPHSTSEDNAAGRASGWKDVDLAAEGKRQAEELAARCKERGVDVIICSDLQRAVKTAIPSARTLHVPVYVDARLRECDYGELEGKPKGIVMAEHAKHIDTPFPGGESYRQVMQRMEPFFTELQQKFAGKTMLIIGHRATHYALDMFIGGKTLEQSIAEANSWKWQPGWKYEII